MFRIKFVIIVFLLIQTVGFGQNLNEIGGRLGFGISNYNIKEKIGLSKQTKASEVSLNFLLFNRNTFKKNDKFAWSYGLGVVREYLDFEPMIKFKEIPALKDFNLDTLLISEVANWEWQFSIPIDLSFKLFEQTDVIPNFFVIPGMRINVGIENRFTFNRINTDNFVLSYYDNYLNEGYEYYEETVNKQVSKYYSDNIPRYKLLMNAGIEFFSESDIFTAIGGLKFNYYLTSPINCSINKQFSMSAYIGICFSL